VLWGIFVPRGGEATEAWRKPHNEELCNLYHSLNIIRMTNCRRMGWEGNVACMVKMRNSHRISVGKEERTRKIEE
jgi:hypothetical protein